MSARRIGAVVQDSKGQFVAIPTGRSFAVGMSNRLHVRNEKQKDIAIFDSIEWKFGAICDLDQVIVTAVKPKETP